MKIISKKGYIIYKNDLSKNELTNLDEIRKEFFVKPNINPDFCETVNEFKVYRETSEKIFYQSVMELKNLDYQIKLIFQI